MRVVLYDGGVTKDAKGKLEVTSSGYYRLVLPGRELARRGHEVHLAQEIEFDHRSRRLVGVLHGGDRVTDVDVILIKHGPTAAWQLVLYGRLARRNGQMIAHDFDDWGSAGITLRQALNSPRGRPGPSLDLVVGAEVSGAALHKGL